jgi:hypothetical protein
MAGKQAQATDRMTSEPTKHKHDKQTNKSMSQASQSDTSHNSTTSKPTKHKHDKQAKTTQA